MTRISEYTVISTPELDDLLIGTDKNNSDITKNFSISGIVELIGDINQGPIGPQGNAGPTGPQGPVGPAGLEWRGEWSSGTSYILDDAVGYGGASYFCVQAVGPSANTPDVDISNWALLASQGAVGPTGPAGPIGPQGPQGDGTQTIKVQKTTITQAQILQLFTTPITILDSTTSGVAKIPLNIMCKRTGVGTNYTIESNQFKLQAATSGSTFSMTLYNTFLTSTSDLVSYVNLSFNASSQLFSGVDGESYKLGCYTSNPTSGTGDMDVYVTYIEYSI